MRSKRLIGLVLILVVVVGVAIYAGSQATSGGSKTVTGCLQKGDEPNEYSITDANGRTYGLYSSSVQLADHVGHKVTVTGQAKAETLPARARTFPPCLESSRTPAATTWPPADRPLR